MVDIGLCAATALQVYKRLRGSLWQLKFFLDFYPYT